MSPATQKWAIRDAGFEIVTIRRFHFAPDSLAGCGHLLHPVAGRQTSVVTAPHATSTAPAV